MADSYGTQLDTMQQASQHVADVNQQIQAQLSALLSRLEPLAGAWKGSSAVSFEQLKVRWHEDATTLNNALRDISEAIAVSGTTYRRSDESQQQSFSSISSVLG